MLAEASPIQTSAGQLASEVSKSLVLITINITAETTGTKVRL
jgi:hypothetical protein